MVGGGEGNVKILFIVFHSVKLLGVSNSKRFLLNLSINVLIAKIHPILHLQEIKGNLNIYVLC